MSYQVVNTPIESFYGTDGKPLDNGYIYIGTANLNPETNPIAIYWDRDFTQPAANPVRTVSGYPSRNGIASRIYIPLTTGAYSITVRESNNTLVFSKLSSDYVLTDVTVGPVSIQISADAATASAAAAAASVSEVNAAASEATAVASSATAVSAAQTAAAYANMEWAGFAVTDGELIVSYTSGATSLPSLSDGEFIITY